MRELYCHNGFKVKVFSLVTPKVEKNSCKTNGGQILRGFIKH